MNPGPKFTDKSTYYYWLNIENEDCNQAAIKQAYREILTQYHPDRTLQEPNANIRRRNERILKQAKSAYSVLSNKVQRAEYDRLLQWDRHTRATSKADKAKSHRDRKRAAKKAALDRAVAMDGSENDPKLGYDESNMSKAEIENYREWCLSEYMRFADWRADFAVSTVKNIAWLAMLFCGVYYTWRAVFNFLIPQ